MREPEFDSFDVALLVASRRAERIVRGSHGIPLSEATNPAHQYEWEVGLPIADFAQEKLSREMKAYKKAYPDADMDALLWRVSRG